MYINESTAGLYYERIHGKNESPSLEEWMKLQSLYNRCDPEKETARSIKAYLDLRYRLSEQKMEPNVPKREFLQVCHWLDQWFMKLGELETVGAYIGVYAKMGKTPTHIVGKKLQDTEADYYYG